MGESAIVQKVQEELINHYNNDRELRVVVPASFLEAVQDRANVLRFCRTKKFDLVKSVEAFIDNMKWRHEFGVEALRADNIDRVLMTSTLFYFNRYPDRQGRPVAIAHVINSEKRVLDPKEIRRFTVFQIEAGIKLLPKDVENLTLVIDLTQFGNKNMDVTYAQFLANCFDKYYPERLGVCLLYNAPWIFNSFWKLINTFLDDELSSKFVFVTNEEIFDYIDQNKLPKKLGGILEDAEYGHSQGHKRGGSSSGMSDFSAINYEEFHEHSYSPALLEVEPSSVINFTNITSKESSSTVKIKNINPFTISYKFKTTNPKIFTVSPNMGLLHPEEQTSIVIEIKIDDESLNSQSSKEKILIQTSQIERVSEENLVEYWRKIESEQKDKILEKKMKCRFYEGEVPQIPSIQVIPASNTSQPASPMQSNGSTIANSNANHSNSSNNPNSNTPHRAHFDPELIEKSGDGAEESERHSSQKKKNIFKRVAMRAVRTIQLSPHLVDNETPESTNSPQGIKTSKSFYSFPSDREMKSSSRTQSIPEREKDREKGHTRSQSLTNPVLDNLTFKPDERASSKSDNTKPFERKEFSAEAKSHPSQNSQQASLNPKTHEAHHSSNTPNTPSTPNFPSPINTSNLNSLSVNINPPASTNNNNSIKSGVSSNASVDEQPTTNVTKITKAVTLPGDDSLKGSNKGTPPLEETPKVLASINKGTVSSIPAEDLLKIVELASNIPQLSTQITELTNEIKNVEKLLVKNLENHVSSSSSSTSLSQQHSRRNYVDLVIALLVACLAFFIGFFMK